MKKEALRWLKIGVVVAGVSLTCTSGYAQPRQGDSINYPEHWWQGEAEFVRKDGLLLRLNKKELVFIDDDQPLYRDRKSVKLRKVRKGDWIQAYIPPGRGEFIAAQNDIATLMTDEGPVQLPLYLIEDELKDRDISLLRDNREKSNYSYSDAYDLQRNTTKYSIFNNNYVTPGLWTNNLSNNGFFQIAALGLYSLVLNPRGRVQVVPRNCWDTYQRDYYNGVVFKDRSTFRSYPVTYPISSNSYYNNSYYYNQYPYRQSGYYINNYDFYNCSPADRMVRLADYSNVNYNYSNRNYDHRYRNRNYNYNNNYIYCTEHRSYDCNRCDDTGRGYQDSYGPTRRVSSPSGVIRDGRSRSNYQRAHQSPPARVRNSNISRPTSRSNNRLASPNQHQINPNVYSRPHDPAPYRAPRPSRIDQPHGAPENVGPGSLHSSASQRGMTTDELRSRINRTRPQRANNSGYNVSQPHRVHRSGSNVSQPRRVNRPATNISRPTPRVSQPRSGGVRAPRATLRSNPSPRPTRSAPRRNVSSPRSNSSSGGVRATIK